MQSGTIYITQFVISTAVLT